MKITAEVYNPDNIYGTDLISFEIDERVPTNNHPLFDLFKGVNGHSVCTVFVQNAYVWSNGGLAHPMFVNRSDLPADLQWVYDGIIAAIPPIPNVIAVIDTATTGWLFQQDTTIAPYGDVGSVKFDGSQLYFEFRKEFSDKFPEYQAYSDNWKRKCLIREFQTKEYRAKSNVKRSD